MPFIHNYGQSREDMACISANPTNTQPMPKLHALVTMPSKGNKEALSRFIDPPSPQESVSVLFFFEAKLRPLINTDIGSLTNAAVVLSQGSNPIEVSALSDELPDYVAMGLKKLIFYVDQPSRAEPAPAPLGAQLVRMSNVELPQWSHGGRPALNKLFKGIRDALEKDKLGFVGSNGAKLGSEWMQSLMNLLYGISTFHDNFKARGFKMPDRFAFSKGADDCKEKGKKPPVLKQDTLAEYLAKAHTLALYAFLDDERWADWKSDMDALAVGLQHVQDDLKRRAAAEEGRANKVQKTIGASFQLPTNNSGAPQYRSPGAVNAKYNELDAVLNTLQSYHPLSLTGFEPTNRGERYEWLENLRLSVPCVILKADVGGSIGTLHWVLKRLDVAAEFDSEQIEDARELIKPLIPQIHSRALKRHFASRIAGLAKMSESARTFLYKELTGDESNPQSLAEKERFAYLQQQTEIAETFALGIGDLDIIVDIRTIVRAARTGSTSFGEFWQCVQEELDSMNTAADERRHGGVVAWLSEVVSHEELFERCLARFEAKKGPPPSIDLNAKVPSISWFKYQFWPSNEHVRSAFRHIGRFPLRLQLQVRNLRKEHAHAYYCAKQKSLVEDWIIKYRDSSAALQPDDKQNLNLGEPGTAASLLSKQKSTMGRIDPADQQRNISGQQNTKANSRAIDHDAGSVKMRIVPTVHLYQDIPKHRDESWCRGQVSIILKESIFEASEANKAMAEIEKTVKRMGGFKPNLWEHADGGGKHHTNHPSVIVATINLWLRNNSAMDRLIKTRGCPYHSYLHEVEKIMSIINLALYNLAMERPVISQASAPGMENRFRSCKNMAELRAFGLRFPQMVTGLHEAINPLFDLLHERFNRLKLKGQLFQRGEGVTAAEADSFFDSIKQFLSPTEQTLKRGDIKRRHLASSKLKKFIDTHTDCDPYKIEIDKKCWRNRFIALRAECGGELPGDKVAEVLASFKCEFGCPPPVGSIEEFVDMHPVPRPKMVAGGKYDTFEATYGTPTPISIPPLNGNSKEELAPSGVLEKKNVQGTIRCISCHRLRCVYVKTVLSRVKAFEGAQITLHDQLVDMLDANKLVYSCGSDIDLTGYDFSANARPYVRMKLDCSMHMELQLYSSGILATAEADAMCGYCGEEGRRVQADTEAAPVLPICPACETQWKARVVPGATRFDRGGQRAAQQQAAQQRTAQIAQARDAAATTTAATAAAATAATTPAATSGATAATAPAIPAAAVTTAAPAAATAAVAAAVGAAAAAHAAASPNPFSLAARGCQGRCCLPTAAPTAAAAAAAATAAATTTNAAAAGERDGEEMDAADGDEQEGEAWGGGEEEELELPEAACSACSEEGDAEDEAADAEEEERMCDKCKTSMPCSQTTLSLQINGWICKDSAACEVRCAPAPRARRQNYGNLAAHGHGQ